MVLLRPGNLCRFRLVDVICPDRQQILAQITPELEVAGEIVLLSDAGGEPEKFAIIQVAGIASPLIVPAGRVQLVSDEQRSQATPAAPSI